MTDIKEYNSSVFEGIKHVDENGNEYWLARELQKVLEYKEWRYFQVVIEKAQVACSQSKNNINYNFGVNTKIVKTGVSTKTVIDYKLSRYACYLIVQNANPKIEAVALGQTYFAVQTRKQELSEKEYESLSEDEKRFYQRNLTKKGNYSLNQAAKEAGVKNFGLFHDAGYKGLYEGETANEMTSDNMKPGDIFCVIKKDISMGTDIIEYMLESNDYFYQRLPYLQERFTLFSNKDTSSYLYPIIKDYNKRISKDINSMLTFNTLVTIRRQKLIDENKNDNVYKKTTNQY